MCSPFHTLVGAFRRRRAALAENSTSFSQKLPIFGENSTTFRRKSTRLRALYPAVAAFSPIVGLHSPLILHQLPDKPRLLLSSFAVTRRNDSVAPKGVKWGTLKSAQLHDECAKTAVLLLKIRNKHTHLDNDTSPGKEKAHRIARNEKRLFDFTSHTPQIRLKPLSLQHDEFANLYFPHAKTIYFPPQPRAGLALRHGFRGRRQRRAHARQLSTAGFAPQQDVADVAARHRQGTRGACRGAHQLSSENIGRGGLHAHGRRTLAPFRRSEKRPRAARFAAGGQSLARVHATHRAVARRPPRVRAARAARTTVGRRLASGTQRGRQQTGAQIRNRHAQCGRRRGTLHPTALHGRENSRLRPYHGLCRSTGRREVAR